MERKKHCWKIKESNRHDNRKYYVNTDSNISQWGISSPDLPFGWEMFTSRNDDNFKYYYNKYNDIVKIEKPTEKDAVRLPDGWTAKKTEKCNAFFYVNESENKSQWEYPEAYPKSRETRSGPPRSYHHETESDYEESGSSTSSRRVANSLSSKQGSQRSDSGDRSRSSRTFVAGSLSSKEGSQRSDGGDRSSSSRTFVADSLSSQRSHGGDTSSSTRTFVARSLPSEEGSQRSTIGSRTSGSSSSYDSARAKQGSPRATIGSLTSGSSQEEQKKDAENEKLYTQLLLNLEGNDPEEVDDD